MILRSTFFTFYLDTCTSPSQVRTIFLSYFSIIHMIVWRHLIDLPTKISDKLRLSANIFIELINLGGKMIVDNGRPILVPESKPINDWIFAPNALPKQYWNRADPKPGAQVASPLVFHRTSSSGASIGLPPLMTPMPSCIDFALSSPLSPLMCTVAWTQSRQYKYDLMVKWVRQFGAGTISTY
jgi:hypothetical protein